jgi:O-acetyl-ADP-ribose deacetylase (regulator of RNase III)
MVVTSLNYKMQDILTIKEGLLVHQVNCRGVMGKGLALKIRKKWPKVYEKYVQEYNRGHWQRGKIQVVRVTDSIVVCNLAGQLGFGGEGIYTDYDAIEKGLSKAQRFAKQEGLHMCIPYKMGCGLGGGYWTTVKAIIARVCGDCTIYCLDKNHHNVY